MPRSAIASNRYGGGGSASRRGVVMGKGSRCYNPEGQRARGPEGQRARGPEGQAGVVMSWALPLVGCGGPAVSRCGHETRRHRVRGALFASVFASVLLAACGGGSGGNLTTSSESEPGPPGTGPLTATGGGDGQGSESENEQQQQKSIVNQEEEIVVNIQPEPEEEESEEEQEQQQQQLTIIEEEDIPYVEQEEEEPRYSAATQTQTQATNGLNIPDGLNIGEKIPDKVRVTTSLGYTESLSFPAGITGGSGFPYGLEASERFIDNKIRFLTLSGFLNPNTRPGIYTPHKHENPNASEFPNVRYKREDGFKGIYIYEGETGELTGDVELKLGFQSGYIQVDGNISSDLEIEGNDLGGIFMTLGDINSTTGLGSYTPGGITSIYFGTINLSDGTPDVTTMNNQGQPKLRMVLSPDGRHGVKLGSKVVQPIACPSYIAGELQINGFKINSGDRDTNTLVGAFIGDNQEIPPRKNALQRLISAYTPNIELNLPTGFTIESSPTSKDSNTVYDRQFDILKSGNQLSYESESLPDKDWSSRLYRDGESLGAIYHNLPENYVGTAWNDFFGTGGQGKTDNTSLTLNTSTGKLTWAIGAQSGASKRNFGSQISISPSALQTSGAKSFGSEALIEHGTHEGTFYGIPGTFNCDGSTTVGGKCQAVADGVKGWSINFADSFTFTPTDGTSALLDKKAPHVYFGYWLTVPENEGESWGIETFSIANSYEEPASTPPTSGTASFSGPATGIYTLPIHPNKSGTTGQFYATVNLTANWGSTATISGNINNFDDLSTEQDSSYIGDWSLDLGSVNLTQLNERFTGRSTTGSGPNNFRTGSWTGHF